MYKKIEPINTQSDSTITGMLQIFNLFEKRLEKEKVHNLKQLNKLTPKIQWLDTSYIIDIYKEEFAMLQPLDYFESGHFDDVKIRYVPLSMFNYTTTQDLKRFYDTNNLPIEMNTTAFNGLDFKSVIDKNNLSISCAFEVDGALRITKGEDDDIRFGMTTFLRLSKNDVESIGITKYYNFPNEDNRVGKPTQFIETVVTSIEHGYDVIIAFSSVAFIEKAMYEFRVSTLRPIIEHYISNKETSSLMFEIGHMIQRVNVFDVFEHQLKMNIPNTFEVSNDLIKAYTAPSILKKIEKEHSKYYEQFYMTNVVNSVINLHDRVSSINRSIVFDDYINLYKLILNLCKANSITPEFQEIMIKNSLGLKLTDLLHQIEHNEQVEYINDKNISIQNYFNENTNTGCGVLGIKSSQFPHAYVNKVDNVPYNFIIGIFNEMYDCTFPSQVQHTNSILNMQLQFVDYEAEIFKDFDTEIVQFVVKNLKKQIRFIDDRSSEHNALLNLTRLTIQHLEIIIRIFEHIGGNSYEIKPILMFVMLQNSDFFDSVKLPQNYEDTKKIICGSNKFTMQEYLLVSVLTLFTNSTLCIINTEQ